MDELIQIIEEMDFPLLLMIISQKGKVQTLRLSVILFPVLITLQQTEECIIRQTK